MSILRELAKAMTDTVAKDRNKLRHIDLEDLRRLVKSNIAGHNDLNMSMSTLSDSDLQTLYRDQVMSKFQSASDLEKIYNTYIRKLHGKAKHEEAKVPLSSIRNANATMAPLMNEILKEIDNVFDNEAITLFNVRMSQAAVIGLIKQSSLVINFSTMLFTGFTALATNTYDGTPKYRLRYMTNNVDMAATIISYAVEKKGSYTLLDEIKVQKRQHADVVLGATGKFDFLSHLTQRRFSLSFLDNIATFLSALNFFSSAIEAWDDYLLDKHARNKETSEWLRNRVTLLRMRLDGMDETSPEYQNQIRIIKNYEEKITDYDARILKFEQED